MVYLPRFLPTTINLRRQRRGARPERYISLAPRIETRHWAVTRSMFELWLSSYRSPLSPEFFEGNGITTFPLKELVIRSQVSYDKIRNWRYPPSTDWQCIEPSHLKRLLVIFTSHLLRKLILTLVNGFTPVLIGDIFAAIPSLEQLGLIHSDALH